VAIWHLTCYHLANHYLKSPTMRYHFTKTTLFVLLAIALTVVSSSVSAQRYYGNPRGPRNFYPSPRVYTYAPRQVFRPSLSINLGFDNRFASPYNAYHRSFIPYGPSIGCHINTLPFGYYPFSYDNNYYYYHNNTFYRRNNDRNYEVVNPPIGAKLPELPRDARPVSIDGNRYYELGGTYYQETYNGNNDVLYEVVGVNGRLSNNKGYNNQNSRTPTEGDIVDRLPEQCRTITLNGQTLYISPDNIYYQKETDNKGTYYKVVGR
jgi:hypothetical protein